MSGTVLPPERLRRALDALLAATEADDSSLLGVGRQLVQPLLAIALLAPRGCDEIEAALGEVSRSGGLSFPESPDDDLPEAVLAGGLEALDDRQMARLALDPVRLRAWSLRLDDAVAVGEAGLYWSDPSLLPNGEIPADYLGAEAIRRATEAVRDLDRATRPEPDLVPMTCPASSVSAKLRMAGLASGLAASVLAAGFLAGRLEWRTSDPLATLSGSAILEKATREQKEQLLLALAAEQKPGNEFSLGPPEVDRLGERGSGSGRGAPRFQFADVPFKGFATVVTLSEGGAAAPYVYPIYPGDDELIAVRPGRRAVIRLPNNDVARSARAALIVITPTPAGESLLSSFDRSDVRFGPNQLERLEQVVREALRTANFAPMAIRSVELPRSRAPAPKE